VGLEINRKTKTVKVGSILSLILGIIAFFTALFEAGIGCLLIIPFFFIGLLGSTLGAIPFIGPVLYYLGVGWFFDIILRATGFTMPISTGIIFYSNLIFSIIYCFVTTSITIIWLALGKKMQKAKEELKNLGTENKDKSS